jgi:hypothetical protein
MMASWSQQRLNFGLCVLLGKVKTQEKVREPRGQPREDINNWRFVGAFVAAGLIAVDPRWREFAVVLVDGGALSVSGARL